jgi:hypothetical protein
MIQNKKILVIAMLDSIHTARWLEQFQDANITFTLFPSKKFRKLHPRIRVLLRNTGIAKYNYYNHIPVRLAGYFDYVENYSKLAKTSTKKKRLQSQLLNPELNYVHALEMQGAGYLLLQQNIPGHIRTIVSNWGSDIYYFQEFDDHLEKIKAVLASIHAYSAECVRDYELAFKFGFRGTFLPCIPNAGGHDVPLAIKNPMNRTQIIVKGYGGEFGRANILVPYVRLILDKYPWVNFFFYSTTPDVYKQLEHLMKRYQDRLRVLPLSKKMSHDKIQIEFQNSRIYVGCSISDGISTSFLEAIANGAYPIQTNTSCANEWVSKGAIASIVQVEGEHIYNEILRVLEDESILCSAFEANKQVALSHLDSQSLARLSSAFYEI